ncbi:hypothetical protein RSAG8_12788, partial [Rhizoctonia solani AG-8 WAC10335]
RRLQMRRKLRSQARGQL